MSRSTSVVSTTLRSSSLADQADQPQQLQVHEDQADHDAERSVPGELPGGSHPYALFDDLEVDQEGERAPDDDPQRDQQRKQGELAVERVADDVDVAAEQAQQPAHQEQAQDAEADAGHHLGEPGGHPDHLRLVDQRHADEHGERTDRRLHHDAAERLLVELADHADEDTFHDGVRGDGDRVGDPHEADRQDQDQAGDHRPEQRHAVRRLGQEQPRQRADDTDDPEQPDGTDHHVVDRHRLG